MEETWDEDGGSAKTFEQPPATSKLGIGRGKSSFATASSEPAPVSKWNGGGGASSSGSFNTFRSNNDENSNPNNGGGFGARSGGNSFGARTGQGAFGNSDSNSFRTGNDGNSRSCYNCKQTGHMSRECPEPRQDNQGSRGGRAGGFGAGGFGAGDSHGGFRSSGTGGSSFQGFRSQNSDSQGGMNGDSKPTFGGWRGGATNASSNDVDDASRRPPFGGSSTGGFRGGRGGAGGGFGFGSGDRENRTGGGGGGGNCYNCNQPGHQSRDCPEPKRPRDGGGSSFFGGGAGRRNDRVSDDIFDQPGGHAGAQPVERYIPPPPPTTEADIFGEAVSRGENFGKYHRTQARCTPEGRVKPIELYEEANLPTQVLSNIRRAHFEEPTPIQRYALPCIQQRDDLMACAQTGSGKTAAFLLPIISNLLQFHADELSERGEPPSPLCLVVSPTRELALQTEREARKFAYQTPVIPCSAVGGHDMFAVSDRLREGCHILSATTGRLKDMVEKGRISLKKVKYFVLDEADRMLDTGFEPDIRKLEALGLPRKEERVTSMFSATFPDEVQRLAKHFLRDNYVFLAVGILGGANEDIAQTIEQVPQAGKKDRLFQLLEENLKSERCLIFVETKRSADYIGALLSQRNFMSTTMHGDRTQRQRMEAVQQFTNGKCPILVATSVAARGLDFPLIGYVVNYDLPDSTDFYIHRIGRTGRAGHLGKSISFFDPDRESDRSIASALALKLGEAGQEIPEFLKRYTEGGSGFSRSTFTGKTTDMRSDTFGHSQASAPTGGSAAAGAAEDWD